MNEIITTIVDTTTPPAALPVPDAPINVRLATREDMPFIDALQKQHAKQLGFFTRGQMQGYIDNGWVLVAESKDEGGRMKDEVKAGETTPSSSSSFIPQPSPLLGYVASRDRYLKRDELGIIYQLCVTPGVRRKLVGATLLKAVFERAAYGTKLYCCWCAQDLKANLFWESMGFVPLAVRAGSEKKARTHIFWQKRIRLGDEQTPWWYPSGTDSGAMRAGRIVVPIPPGVSWREAAVPVVDDRNEPEALATDISGGGQTVKRAKKKPVADASGSLGVPVKRSAVQMIGLGDRGLRFGAAKAAEVVVEKKPAEKPKRERKKVDPQTAARARELRDRWMEAVNAGAAHVALPAAKYEVSRTLSTVDGSRAIREAKVAGQIAA